MRMPKEFKKENSPKGWHIFQVSAASAARSRIWLPFVDTYRTFCLAPGPEAKELLLGVQQLTHLLASRQSTGTNSTGSLGGELR
jgi:hypothetical protein